MSFDTLAPHYRKMEALLAGKILQRARTAFLPQTADSRHALLLGEGPGKFLTALLETNPRIQAHCVEQSPAMIREAGRALANHGLDETRVTFQQTDALTWQPPRRTFDLIVTHFFLDCFTPAQLQRLIPAIAASATPHARWLLTDFQIPTTGWPRHRARIIHALMYKFFRLTTQLPATRLTPPDPYLTAAHFHRTQQKHFNLSLIHADLWLRTEY